MRAWFAAVLGVPCRIVQQRHGARSVRRPTGQGQGQRQGQGQGQAGAQEKQQLHPAGAPGRQLGAGGEVAGGEAAAMEGAGEGTGEGAGAAEGCRGPPLVGFANDGQYLLVSQVGWRMAVMSVLGR